MQATADVSAHDEESERDLPALQNHALGSGNETAEVKQKMIMESSEWKLERDGT